MGWEIIKKSLFTLCQYVLILEPHSATRTPQWMVTECGLISARYGAIRQGGCVSRIRDRS
ncbi:hypothetical protein QL093DRAFT_2341555, partial [Fusarium oxysporum]